MMLRLDIYPQRLYVYKFVCTEDVSQTIVSISTDHKSDRSCLENKSRDRRLSWIMREVNKTVTEKSDELLSKYQSEAKQKMRKRI
jgi:hypothetical protein